MGASQLPGTRGGVGAGGGAGPTPCARRVGARVRPSACVAGGTAPADVQNSAQRHLFSVGSSFGI